MEQVTAIRQAAEPRLPYVLVDAQRLDLSAGDQAKLQLSFSPSVWDAELFLVIDLYSAARPVHPEGHVGWWKWPLEVKRDVAVQVTKGPEGFRVTFDGVAPGEFWINPDYSGLDEPVIALHVVLRPTISEAVRFDDILYLYNSPDALRESVERRTRLDSPSGWVPSSPWFVWPRESTIHLVSTNAFERDAVGNFAINLHRLFRANGVPCQLYASQFDPALRETIRHTCELFTLAGENDVLLMNFSIFEPWLPRLAELPTKKILYFHNITPPRFLQVYDAEYAAHCANGIAQLKYIGQFDALMANSTSSARLLQRMAGTGDGDGNRDDDDDVPLEVVASPPIIGPKAWHDVVSEPIELPTQATKLLYVGRIAPHKRVEDLFALFERYHALDPDSALVIVGSASFAGYVGFLRYLLGNEYARIKDHVHFYESVSDGQLKTLYQSCAAFVTMSEHEGFCVPVVEAMAFDMPVFAYADEAVLETLGRSGRVFYSKEFDAIAADLHSVVSTSWKQRSIVSAQRERIKQIVQRADGQAFWATLEKVCTVRVLFNTYPVAFGCPGGGEIQLLKCQHALEALGINVKLFDPWRPQFESVDLVHYFSVQGGSMNFCAYVKKIGLPLVISPVLWLTPENRRRFPLGEIRDLLHLCDRILPNSQVECEQLADEFGLESENFTVVPNGVDPQFGVPADPQAFRQRFGVHFPFLLNAANIEPRKNQLLLVRVAKRMQKDVVLLGHARDPEYLRDCLAAGESRVHYVGPLDHGDPLLRSAYRACQVFVLPSLLETPGLAALEAAAQGARVVITGEGATREYFGPLVSYVDPADPDALAAAIEEQWSARPGDELRSHVLANFTWAHAGRALADAYERTLLAGACVH